MKNICLVCFSIYFSTAILYRGFISDKYGRKTCFTSLLGSAIIIPLIFMQIDNIWVYAAWRTFQSLLAAGGLAFIPNNNLKIQRKINRQNFLLK